MNKGNTLIKALVFFVFLSSCSKEKDNSLISTPEKSISQSTLILNDPSNPNNPVDSLGVMHNQGLDYIAFHNQFQTLNIFNKTVEFFDDVIGWGQIYIAEINSLENDIISISSDMWDIVINDSATYLEGLVQYTMNVCEFCTAPFEDQLTSLMSVLGNDRESYLIEEMVNEIISIESTFPSSNFSDEEVLLFNVTATVFRYSLSYWNAVMEDETENHPYYNKLESFINNQQGNYKRINWKKVWKVCAVVGVDALCGAAGAGVGYLVSWGNHSVAAAIGGPCAIQGSAAFRDL